MAPDTESLQHPSRAESGVHSPATVLSDHEQATLFRYDQMFSSCVTHEESLSITCNFRATHYVDMYDTPEGYVLNISG